MSLFRLSNQIFSLGLNNRELTVYAYLSSLPSDTLTVEGAAIIKVKQTTIGRCCGIRSVQTVAKVLAELTIRGLLLPLERSTKPNGHKGTYSYAVTRQPTDSGYFMVERRVFGMLVPRQMFVYLFLCKSYSLTRRDCWNSYNDIAAQTGIKRETVIQTIQELVDTGLIVRMKRRSHGNRRVYTDNHYQIVRFERGHIRKKLRRYNYYSNMVYVLYTEEPIPDDIPAENRIRGSPKFESLYSVPIYTYNTEKEV